MQTVSLIEWDTRSVVIYKARRALPYQDPCSYSSGLRKQVKPVNVGRNFVDRCTDRVLEKVRTHREGNVNAQPGIKWDMREQRDEVSE